MKKLSRFNDQGFTLIELLIVILILAILAIIGLTQYVNYTRDAKNSTTKSNLQILRRGIGNANAFVRTRCAYNGAQWPLVATLESNDLTTDANFGAACLAAPANMVAGSNDSRVFGTYIPINPWSPNPNVYATTGAPAGTDANNIDECVGTSCTLRGNQCTSAGTDRTGTAADLGWCYRSSTGEIWANSSGNDGLSAGSGDEHLY